METPEKLKKQLDRLYDAELILDIILAAAGQDDETQYKKKYLDILDVLREFDRKLYELLHDTYFSTIMDLDEMVDKINGEEPEIEYEKPLDAQGVELGCMGKIDIKSVSKVVGL